VLLGPQSAGISYTGCRYFRRWWGKEGGKRNRKKREKRVGCGVCSWMGIGLGANVVMGTIMLEQKI